MKEWIIIGGCIIVMFLESLLYYFMFFIILINFKKWCKNDNIIGFFLGMYIRDEIYMRFNIFFNLDVEILRIFRKLKRKCNENIEFKVLWYIGFCEKYWMFEILMLKIFWK